MMITDCKLDSKTSLNNLTCVLLQNKYYYVGLIEYDIEPLLGNLEHCTYSDYLGDIQ